MWQRHDLPARDAEAGAGSQESVGSGVNIQHSTSNIQHSTSNVNIRNPILQLRARTTKIWTAVAACRGEAQRRLERSGDTAFRTAGCFQKRRGASLPAAVQKIVVAAKGRVRFIRG
jgi:hypothetical protein